MPAIFDAMPRVGKFPYFNTNTACKNLADELFTYLLSKIIAVNKQLVTITNCLNDQTTYKFISGQL